MIVAMIAATLWIAHVSTGDTAEQFTATVFLTVTCFSLLLWCGFDSAFETMSPSAIFSLLVLTRIAALFAEPLLEDDHFRYLWDGFVTATKRAPYAFPPLHYFADSSVPATMQSVLNGINHPEISTIYGPVLQWCFALGYWIAPAALWPFKLLLLLAELLVVALLVTQRMSPSWILLLVLHPLLLKESAISAHPDLLIGAALLAATVAWKNGREATAASVAALAVAMKISAIIALPFFLFTLRGYISRRGLLGATLTLLVCYAPLLSGRGELSAIGIFSAQWTFNPLLFQAFEIFVGDVAARVVVAVLFSLGWLIISWRWIVALRASNTIDVVRFPPIVPSTFLLLMLSPAANPWYWLWILPIAVWQASTGSVIARTAVIAASVSLLAYSHIGVQLMAHSSITTFDVPWWASLGQGVAIVSALLVFSREGKIVRDAASRWRWQ